MSEDLIATARRLARASPRRPRQADLRRAVSTAYYALFHALARQCADTLIGVGPTRNDEAWTHVYRALEHGFAKNVCKRAEVLGFSAGLVNFADAFVRLQDERHRADYDSDVRYVRTEVHAFIANAERAIVALRNAPRRERQGFAVLVLLKRR